jgi:DNA-directed RNA polymerase subunit M/transcription elongation factor TFIIS
MADITIENYQKKCIVNKDNKKFLTELSGEISQKFLEYADFKINRVDTYGKLCDIFMDPVIARKIELGIFEFALTNVLMKNLKKKFAISSYYDKANEIISNLTADNHINNTTLLNKIENGEIKPQMVAFMSPAQIHPDRWRELLQKQNRQIEAETNRATTDMYKCRKCGERKMTMYELQTRSADEPTTKFFTCIVCYNTFTIG